MAKHFVVKQIRSATGRLPKHIRTMDGLGLGKVGREVKLADTPQIRGMIQQVQYLVTVTPVEGAFPKETHPKRAERRAADEEKRSRLSAPVSFWGQSNRVGASTPASDCGRVGDTHVAQTQSAKGRES